MPQKQVARRSSQAQTRQRRMVAIAAVIVGLLVIAVLGVNSLSGRDTSDSATASNSPAVTGNGPQLAVDQTEANFGDVAYGQQVDAVYRITNTGDAVLIIDEPSIKTLEGC